MRQLVKLVGKLYLNRIKILYLSSPFFQVHGHNIHLLGRVYNALVGRVPELLQYSPWRTELKILHWGDDVSFTDGQFTLKITKEYALILLKELHNWNQWYGNGDFSNKIVMDAGAGCGETIYWYAKHGCRNFVAIESNQKCIRYLEENSRVNGWNTKIINDFFNIEHLKITHDYLKLDVEGGEKTLLDDSVTPELLGSFVVELHPSFIGVETCQMLIEKFHLKLVDKEGIYST